jgi:hypothetical protein
MKHKWEKQSHVTADLKPVYKCPRCYLVTANPNFNAECPNRIPAHVKAIQTIQKYKNSLFITQK